MSFLKRVTRENFAEYQNNILEIERDSFAEPWDLNSFSKELSRSVSHLWVSLVDEVLKGYICFWIFADEVHLMNIAVHRLWRRKGLGAGLLRKMLEVGAQRGSRSAWLEVRPSNLSARSLYSRTGFRQVGVRPGYYRETGEDAIVMTLNLPSPVVGAPDRSSLATGGRRGKSG